MHKIAEKEFTLEDFSIDHLLGGPSRNLEYDIRVLNDCRNLYLQWDGLSDEERGHINSKIHDKKDIWWQMIQLLPSSYNQTRNVMMNFEVLANVYKSRRGHKLDEWVEFCRWIKTLPYQELITGEDIAMCDSCKHRFTVESSTCACCGEDNISNYKGEE